MSVRIPVKSALTSVDDVAVCSPAMRSTDNNKQTITNPAIRGTRTRLVQVQTQDLRKKTVKLLSGRVGFVGYTHRRNFRGREEGVRFIQKL